MSDLKEWQQQAIDLREKEGLSGRQIAKIVGMSKTRVNDFFAKHGKTSCLKENYVEGIGRIPRILVFDLETRQMQLEGFGLFNQNFSLEQIAEDWSILSFSAKWIGEEEVLYYDVSEYTEDYLLDRLYELFEEAEFAVAHNGRRFDMKRVRARMAARGFKPHSPVRLLDTLEICKKEFGFTSNKLQYVTNLLCKSSKKSSHSKFPGFTLWREFVKGNPEAIQEMREYNIVDVTSLEELFLIIAPWSSTLPNFAVYFEDYDMSDWEECGYIYSNLGKYVKYRHKVTGQYRRGRKNLLSKEERAKLLANIA